MAGHAQLKFVMTECSKTQIRLTGLIYKSLGIDRRKKACFSLVLLIAAIYPITVHIYIYIFVLYKNNNWHVQFMNNINKI